jgi:hypothetical protein
MTPEQKELIVEGERLEKSLGNGHRGDPGTMSDAICYLIRTNRIQLHAEFVSDTACRERMALCPGAKEKHTLNWPGAVALLGSVLGLIWMILRLTGHV